MKTFVIIFRQHPPAPSPEERQLHAAEITEWAQKVIAGDHKLDPRILTPESAWPGQDGSDHAGVGAWPVTALLFLEAHDLAEAEKIAESHPARKLRAVVEVRPWNPPVRPAK